VHPEPVVLTGNASARAIVALQGNVNAAPKELAAQAANALNALKEG
jgi:hypothetical protein